MAQRKRRTVPCNHQKGRSSFDESDVEASYPIRRFVVWIRTGSRNARDEWRKAVNKYGLDANEIQSFGGWITVFDVAADPARFIEFVEFFRGLESWEFAVAGTSVPRYEDDGALICGIGSRGQGATKKR